MTLKGTKAEGCFWLNIISQNILSYFFNDINTVEFNVIDKRMYMV